MVARITVVITSGQYCFNVTYYCQTMFSFSVQKEIIKNDESSGIARGGRPRNSFFLAVANFSYQVQDLGPRL